jgi:hypothetical protein
MEVPLLSNPLSPAGRRLAAGVAATAALAPAAAAEAATTPCGGETLARTFAAWGDSSWYFLAPDGSFEQGALGWSLSGGATVAQDADPFGLGGAGDRRSLSLPRGATATSAPFCLRRDARTVRWLQRGRRGGALVVEVVHLDPGAQSPGRTLEVLRGGGAWAPSPEVKIPLWGTGASADGVAMVALKLTALTGDWAIDDVYVDPKLRR